MALKYHVDLRTNSLQVGGDDDLGPTKGLIKGPITRSVLKRIQEDMEHEDSNEPNRLQMFFT